MNKDVKQPMLTNQTDPVQQSIVMSNLAKELDNIDKKLKTIKGFTKDRVELEDQRMKLWWQLRSYLVNKSKLKEDHGIGFSHNVSLPQDQNTMNKPTIGSMTEEKKENSLKYKFIDYNWLANIAGFGKPSDVYYGNVLIGVVVSEEDGYYIDIITGPRKSLSVPHSLHWNKFKTKEQAAKVIHKIWKTLRSNRK